MDRRDIHASETNRSDEEDIVASEDRDGEGRSGHDDDEEAPQNESVAPEEYAADPRKAGESEVAKGRAAHLREGDLREVMETSAHGAPSAGEAVSDIFSTDEIFHRILATADTEFSRSNRLLFLSGLMAGLSVGLSFLARVTFSGSLGDNPSVFLENAFYPVGFVFIIMGRQQLFTENTLTPVTLVMMRLSSIPRLLKLWGIVYIANILGAALMAGLFTSTELLDPEAIAAGIRFGAEGMEHSWDSLFVRGMIAGFMVAGLVWLIHAVRDSVARFLLIYMVFFLIPATGLYHCIIGACEIAFFTIEGGTSVSAALLEFELPVTLGNTVGGLLFVALPNFFQTRRERFREWEQLTWHDWFRGRKELAGHDETSNDRSGEKRESSRKDDEPSQPGKEKTENT